MEKYVLILGIKFHNKGMLWGLVTAKESICVECFSIVLQDPLSTLLHSTQCPQEADLMATSTALPSVSRLDSDTERKQAEGVRTLRTGYFFPRFLLED